MENKKLMDKRGAIRPRDVLILTLVVGLIATSSFMLIGDMNDAYGTNISTELEGSLDKIDEIDEASQGMYEELKESSGAVETIYIIFVEGTWTILKSVLAVFTFIGEIIESVLVELGLGAYGTAIIAIILITVVFTILGAIYKRDL